MQPFHFENFIANYAVLLSLTIVAANLWSFSSRAFLWIAVLCLLWGTIEVYLPARTRSTSDLANDEMVPVLLRLKALSLQDGTFSDLRNQGITQTRVFSPDIAVLRALPTWTSQGVMVGLGGLDFGSASAKEPRVYAYLYYCGIDKTRFVEILKGQTDDLFLNYYTRSAVFGHERVLPELAFHSRPIADSEVEEQAAYYERYVAMFSREEALSNRITYMIVRGDSNVDFSHIDRWYERSTGERVGAYDLFRLTLRSHSTSPDEN